MPTFDGQLVRSPWFYRQWMLAGNPAYFFERIARDFGDFVHYRGLFSFYLINHPELVKQVLQETHKNFDKQTIIYDRFRVAFGNGLVVSESDHWKRQRKLMQPMFVPGAARQFFDLMLDAAQKMTERWQAASQSGSVFNIADEMNRITLEIAGRALFRDGFHESSEQIAHWTEVINEYSAKPPLPIVRSPWFPSRRNWQLQKTLSQFRTFMQALIDKRRQSSQLQDEGSASPPTGARDLLSILMNARDEETGQPMSDPQVMEEALGMIIGGHETSSSALAWLWLELHQHPDILAGVENEIDRVLQGQPLTLAGLGELRLTRMVIEETLRLHPPFWFENRNVMRAVELGGASLPKGAIVVFSRYSLHRHPDFWRDPTRFDPSRFAPEQEENSRTSGAYVPFGYGPRLCIGLNFAMLELLVIVATVVQKYRVTVAAEDRHQMAARLTMTPRYGVKVRVSPRAGLIL